MTNPGTGLVERLRDAEVGYRPHAVGKLLAEAADHIASLEARLSGGGEPVAWRYHEAGVSLWNYATARPPIGADGMPEELWTAEPLYSESALAAVRKERDEARRIARELSVALTGLTGGGSEYFKRSATLDDYFADVEACTSSVRRRFDDGHEAKVAEVTAKRSLTAANATIADLREALRRAHSFILSAPFASGEDSVAQEAALKAIDRALNASSQPKGSE